MYSTVQSKYVQLYQLYPYPSPVPLSVWCGGVGEMEAGLCHAFGIDSHLSSHGPSGSLGTELHVDQVSLTPTYCPTTQGRQLKSRNDCDTDKHK